MRKVVYGLSCVAAVALFAWWSGIAYASRGYWAVGGEYAALLLPLLVAAVDCAIQDWGDGDGDGDGGHDPEEVHRG